ncbi:glycosyltransferase family 2 protein [Nocardioides campestrisoli]|uniref:glycosyltransferase family 2 protein n=1 Tax=Nocardioides campestrisoli TaxID=2736757 RepID=UPI0015E74F02|nr:glycosyltransferase family 2 protein [Nocardioides campestrisoli]
MSPPAVDVAVVVVTYNSADVLPGLLDSLADGLSGLSWHLVVADNDSSDDVASRALDLVPGCTVVRMGRNAGYAAGLNAGVGAAPPHRAVLVLNPDVRLEPGCVARLLDALDRSGAGIAVPRLADSGGHLHLSMRREPTVLRALGDAVMGARRAGRWSRLGELVTDPRVYDHPATPDWAEGSTQLISARCWQTCGGWDESFFLYSEETEYGLRARDAGYATAYVPDARATHLQGDSTSSPGLWALLVANRVRLHRRRHGWLSGTVFWAVVVAREASRTALGRATNRAALQMLTSPRRMRESPGPHTVAWGG